MGPEMVESIIGATFDPKGPNPVVSDVDEPSEQFEEQHPGQPRQCAELLGGIGDEQTIPIAST
jgi:hypothetical protein